MDWVSDAVIRQGDINRATIPQSGGGGMGWVAPAIMAGGSVASSVTGGKAAKEAAKSQERAQAEALKFAREQEATRQAQYGQGFKMWYASQQALRERYGLPPLPPMEAFPSAGGDPGAGADPRAAVRASFAANPGNPVRAVAPFMATNRPATLGAMAGVPGVGAAPAPDPEADLGSWNAWERYRLNS